MYLVAVYFDNYGSVGYSDIDYEVFTDGAKYVLNFESPFERHTYRYTPLLAYFMTPNVFLFKHFGKIIFMALDILAGYLMVSLLKKKDE